MISDIVKCDLCPWSCSLAEGQFGKCRSRHNCNGAIINANPNLITAAIVGPIEQKRIYHYLPKSKLLSIGGCGCNLSCSFCQNYEISQFSRPNGDIKNSNELIDMALSENVDGIAFSYNEPLVNYEYVIEVFKKAKERNLFTVLKTSAMLNQHEFSKVCSFTDCINIDLKGDYTVYKRICKVDPNWMDIVLLNIGTASLLSHVEISIPVITNLEPHALMAAEILSEEVGCFPLHLIRFMPDFKMKGSTPTPVCKMIDISEQLSKIFNYVYLDSVGASNITRCLKCEKILIKRKGIETTYNILNGNCCPRCKTRHDVVVKESLCYTDTNVENVKDL